MPEKGTPTPETDNRLGRNIYTPAEDTDDSLEAPPAPRKTPPRAKAKPAAPRSGAIDVYVSIPVKKRFDAYRDKYKLTNKKAVFKLIEDNLDNLEELVREATVSTAPQSNLFPPDPNAVRYRGTGPETIHFTLTEEQAAVLADLQQRLDMTYRSPWIAAVLNLTIPGGKPD